MYMVLFLELCTGFMKPIHVVQLVEDHKGIILAKVD